MGRLYHGDRLRFSHFQFGVRKLACALFRGSLLPRNGQSPVAGRSDTVHSTNFFTRVVDPDSRTTARAVHDHGHDHVNVHVDVHVIVDVAGFSPRGRSKLRQTKAVASYRTPKARLGRARACCREMVNVWCTDPILFTRYDSRISQTNRKSRPRARARDRGRGRFSSLGRSKFRQTKAAADARVFAQSPLFFRSMKCFARNPHIVRIRSTTSQ